MDFTASPTVVATSKERWALKHGGGCSASNDWGGRRVGWLTVLLHVWSVSSVCVVLHLTQRRHLYLRFDSSPPPVAAVPCDPDEPASWFAHMEEEAGFQKVPEDDSTTTTTSRASCLQELQWDKVDFSAVQFCSLSFIWGGHSVNLDRKQILSFIISCQQPSSFFSLLLFLVNLFFL